MIRQEGGGPRSGSRLERGDSRSSPAPGDVDVVVVHYPSVADLRRCVETLARAPGRVAAVTVVDNAAPEAVPEAVHGSSSVEVVERERNDGFAVAANEGASRGSAPLILFVNPDVRFTPSDIGELAFALGRDDPPGQGADGSPGASEESLSDGGTGGSSGPRVAVGPRLALPDGRPQVGAAGFFPTLASVALQSFPLLARLPVRWAERPLFLYEDGRSRETGRDAVREVDWVSAAFLLVRRDAFEAVGGFDERFFMYGEDIDLCLRLRQRGWRIAYCPAISVVHDHEPAVEVEGPSRPSARALWLEGMDRYYRIHARRSRRLLHGIAALGFALRALAYGLGIARPRSSPERAGRRLAGYAWHALSLALGR